MSTSPSHLEIPDEAKAGANAIYLKYNLNQIKARLDARGQPLPEGVDLYETGDLQDSGFSDALGFGFGAGLTYAEAVDNKYHFVGLSDESQLQADQEVSELFDIEPLELVED